MTDPDLQQRVLFLEKTVLNLQEQMMLIIETLEAAQLAMKALAKQREVLVGIGERN